MMDFPTASESGKTTIHARCIQCGVRKDLTVDTSRYESWRNGALIQRALPEIPKDDRGLLISGMCGRCFDALFDDEGEAA